MIDDTDEPKTLQEAILYFSDPDNCVRYVVARRWPNGVSCPTCGGEVNFLANQRVWQCKKQHPHRQFSVKVGTVMEDSAIKLDKWLTAMWMLVNCKNGISSYEIARDLGISQRSAWHLMHRIRLAAQDEAPRKMSGHVEVDETFIGGKARNMHIDKKRRRITGTGGKDKTIVFGALERGGRVRVSVISDRRKRGLQTQVKAHVEAGSALYSDALKSYDGLAQEYAHKVIDHAEKYVDGQVHTNGLENFWSLLKRGISGTYVSVEPFHLFRYLDEQVFRYNNRSTSTRKLSDADRFSILVSNIFGKRLTFRQLTGREQSLELASHA